ncbi:MAG: hypothetical protein HN576_07675 [Bacteriovoracaceae bacterium]|jgi:hypothetical protein|nr:hypothetical protein [Bacteriovoracaceae bacterium]
MVKRNLIKEMEKGLYDKDGNQTDQSDTLPVRMEVFDKSQNYKETDHRTEESTIGYYCYDYTNKVNGPIEDKTEFGPFESYDETYGVFSYNSNKLYALSNNPEENLIINSDEYDPFQKIPVSDGDVLRIAEFRYVVSDQRIFHHQNAKKVMGKLLVKKSTSGTQKSLEERESEIKSFEKKISERQAIISGVREKVQKLERNKEKVIELQLNVKKWNQDIVQAKEIILLIENESQQLSENDFEKDIDEQEYEISRLEEIKTNLVEKARLAKARLIKMQEAEEKKHSQINSKLLDIEKEELELKRKLAELKKKKSNLDG